MVVPYSTCESLASFVVQLTTAVAGVIADSVTAEITGGVMSGTKEYVMRSEGRRVGSACSALAKYR